MSPIYISFILGFFSTTLVAGFVMAEIALWQYHKYGPVHFKLYKGCKRLLTFGVCIIFVSVAFLIFLLILLVS